MCTSPTTRFPIGARTTMNNCLRSSRSSQSCSDTDLSCYPSADVCLLCAVTPSISSTAGNVLAGRARMMTSTVLHQAMIGASMIYQSLSQPATNRRLSLLLWLRLSDGQGHKQDPLLVGSLTSHTHMFLPVRSCAYDTSLFRLCIVSSQLPPPVRFVHITCGQSTVLVAY